MLCVLVLSILPFAFGAVYVDAPCPDLKPVDNFELAKFASGSWYQVARYPNDFEDKGECVMFYFKNESGRFYLTETEVYEHKKVVFNGYTAYAPNAGSKGMLIFTSSVIKEPESTSPAIPLFVLDIVYNDYAIIFECRYDETKKRRHDYAWLVSRSSKLTDKAKAAIDKYVKQTGLINPDLLIWHHFDKESCRSK